MFVLKFAKRLLLLLDLVCFFLGKGVINISHLLLKEGESKKWKQRQYSWNCNGNILFMQDIISSLRIRMF